MFLTKPGAAVDYPRWESLFPGKLLSSCRHCCNLFAFATNPAYRESTNPTYQDRLSTTSNISMYHSITVPNIHAGPNTCAMVDDFESKCKKTMDGSLWPANWFPHATFLQIGPGLA